MPNGSTTEELVAEYPEGEEGEEAEEAELLPAIPPEGAAFPIEPYEDATPVMIGAEQWDNLYESGNSE